MTTRRCWMTEVITPAISLALIIGSGCTSGGAAKSSNNSSSAARSSGANGHLDILCIGDRINNPGELFHYSYTYTGANGWVEDEAEIAPQAMDVSIKDKSGSHHFHGVRSNEASWNSAVMDLSHLNLPAMSSRLVVLDGSSAIVQQGAESMNGYETTRYAIDTAAASASDRQKFEALFGKGASEKGMAWMASDGCAAKLSLDETVMQGNSLNKAHYEIARLKK